MNCHFLLQGIFPTQGSNLHLSHCRHILYQWAIREAHHGNADFIKWVWRCSLFFILSYIFMLLICVFLFQLKELLLGFLIGHVWWLQIPSAFLGLGKPLSLLHFYMIAFLGKVFVVVVFFFFFPWAFWVYNLILSWNPNPNLCKISADKFVDSHIKIPSYVMIFLVLLLSRFSLCPWFLRASL